MQGFIDNQKIQLFSADEIDKINEDYLTQKYIPLFKIIGSLELDAICIDKTGEIYLIPFIPLSDKHAGKYFDNLETLLNSIQKKLIRISESHPQYNQQLFLKKPLVFGGDPLDESNNLFANQSKHAEVCCYWNKLYREMSNQTVS